MGYFCTKLEKSKSSRTKPYCHSSKPPSGFPTSVATNFDPSSQLESNPILEMDYSKNSQPKMLIENSALCTSPNTKYSNNSLPNIYNYLDNTLLNYYDFTPNCNNSNNGSNYAIANEENGLSEKFDSNRALTSTISHHSPSAMSGVNLYNQNQAYQSHLYSNYLYGMSPHQSTLLCGPSQQQTFASFDVGQNPIHLPVSSESISDSLNALYGGPYETSEIYENHDYNHNTDTFYQTFANSDNNYNICHRGTVRGDKSNCFLLQTDSNVNDNTSYHCKSVNCPINETPINANMEINKNLNSHAIIPINETK